MIGGKCGKSDYLIYVINGKFGKVVWLKFVLIVDFVVCFYWILVLDNFILK